MDVKLVVTGGKNAGREVPVAGPKFVIGRANDCQLRPSSDQIAPRHCEIASEEGRVIVRDFKSASGTFVNDKQVQGQAEVKTGDRLRLGPLEFEIRINVGLGGKKAPKVHSIREAIARTREKAAGDELDVSEWLTATDTGPEASVAETQAPAASETGPHPIGRKSHKPKSVFGEAEASKPASASSRDAAADALRNLFGQK